ncbi:MAG: hypothetical protein JSV68_02835 [Anaerolineaceae bacterium]|nr:MAG: hypothetical protein JSV68_02835 [Anaerolineaceae bacterium]
MVLRRESITERLKELDLIVQELNQYQSLSVEELWLNFQKAGSVFPQFTLEILAWLDEQV